MNRDEQWERATGLPPARRELDGRFVICPSEPGGGTWVAVNDAGIALALLNWRPGGRAPAAGAPSRGGVIPALAGQGSIQYVRKAFETLDFAGMNAFRLVVVDGLRQSVASLGWDGERRHGPDGWERVLSAGVEGIALTGGWGVGHWLSSGCREDEVTRVRGATMRAWGGRAEAGSRDWVRALHASHEPEAGAYSVCVHREDAGTVSYTEVEVDGGRVVMRHLHGPPCRGDWGPGLTETGIS